MRFEDYLMAGIGITLTPLIIFMFYLLFFILPVSMWADAKCLRNGYPKSSVSIGLESYCMNLEGTVTVKVDKASEGKK